MQLVQSAAPPPPPHPTGLFQVKMAKWLGRSCTLTGVNIDTLKASEVGEKEDLLYLFLIRKAVTHRRSRRLKDLTDSKE